MLALLAANRNCTMLFRSGAKSFPFAVTETAAAPTFPAVMYSRCPSEEASSLSDSKFQSRHLLHRQIAKIPRHRDAATTDVWRCFV